ncbi:MAG TPA: multifunctional oxoglutarate decarboxylase/oxoglutarate dehydrogenase thiamine pyrophosphate-binding subunit/dihydrolipoyllysine-residue succinyltransferase subunit, partial [Mycobacterium sp.]
MSSTSSPFGQNEWLVEEMYRKFREDPSSVDPSWHEFLVDYNPEPTGDGSTTADEPTPAAPAAEAVPARSPAQPPPPAPTATVGNGVTSAPVPPAPARSVGPAPGEGDEVQVLRGAAAAVVKNMSQSLDLPTATSVRAIPAKLIIDNRIVINNQLKRTRGGKISFTHLLGYALVQALKAFPNMNRHYADVDGKPTAITPAHINLGLAIDLQGKDGKRSLVVAGIKRCETMRFAQFVTAYEDIVRRARDGKLTAEDFGGVTISLTNPGTIGTVHSVPRLMAGQGAIIGVGAMEYPAEFQGASELRIADLGIGKLITLTSTYDHRIIQGAESGDFLRTIHEMLLSDDFWDDIFREMGVPYLPIRWSTDNPDSIVDKNARVMELIGAYRNRGHLMADIDPLRLDNTRFRSHPDLEVLTHGLTLWDLDRVFKVNGFAGAEYQKLRSILGLLRDAYCRHIGVEYTHILDPEQLEWLEQRVETKHVKPTVAQQKYILSKLNAAEAFETFLQTKYVGQKRFSLEGAESTIPLMDAAIDQCAEHGLDEVVIGMPHRGRLNVLANIVGKPYSQIFSEFEGNLNPAQAHGSGDVKYHLGATGVYLQMFGDNDIQVSLTANPSHLEAVDPVLEGLCRAKQDLLDHGDTDSDTEKAFSVMPMMLHGDAAFAGQGVVAETLNLAKLP